MGAEVDARFGVFDDRSVLDVGGDLEATDRLEFGDVLDRALADHRVRPDPERRTVVAHTLMQDVLEVGGGACDPLDPGRRAAKRRVRRLRDRYPLIAWLLEEVDEAKAIIA